MTKVAERLGTIPIVCMSDSRYTTNHNPAKPSCSGCEQAEIARLIAELRRIIDERDIFKMAAAHFARGYE